MYSVLSDRKLWYDGDSSYNPRLIKKLVQVHDVKYVDSMTPEVETLNKFLEPEDKIRVKKELRDFDTSWNIPEKYLNLNVVHHIADLHYEQFHREPDFEDREVRLALELSLFEKYNIEGMLRAILYVVNTLTKNQCVWGVGRGSSVASYVLYVIGVHDIDSFAFNIDPSEFFHE